MGKKLKVKCSGPEKHINEIDLGKLLQGTIILRGGTISKDLLSGIELHNNYELKCNQCTFKVIVTRETIEDYLNK